MRYQLVYSVVIFSHRFLDSHCINFKTFAFLAVYWPFWNIIIQHWHQSSTIFLNRSSTMLNNVFNWLLNSKLTLCHVLCLSLTRFHTHNIIKSSKLNSVLYSAYEYIDNYKIVQGRIQDFNLVAWGIRYYKCARTHITREAPSHIRPGPGLVLSEPCFFYYKKTKHSRSNFSPRPPPL